MNQDALKEILEYNKDTGIFTWKKAIAQRIKVGDVAGTKTSRGYIQIRINGKSYQAHRLAWLYEHGYMPKIIDHINGVKDDNRICNQREATRSENGCNRGANKNNTSGFKGVYWNKDANKWKAQIQHEGKQINLGYYSTPEEAAEVYRQAAKKYHGEFARV